MKKVLIGCAIVAALAIVLGIGGTVYVVQQYRKAIPDQERTAAVDQALLERDGPVSDYIPPLDGVPTPETVRGYLQIAANCAPFFDADGANTTDFFQEMTAKKGILHKVVGGVRGSVELTRAASHAAARVDSLLLSTGVSEGELAYVHALHRFGLMKFEAPVVDYEASDDESADTSRREMRRALDGIEETVEDGLRKILLRQKQAIEALEDPRPEYVATHEWLEQLLDAHSLFAKLREDGLLPAQAAAFEGVDLELREYAPRNPGAYFLETICYGVDDDDSEGAVRVNFGD